MGTARNTVSEHFVSESNLHNTGSTSRVSGGSGVASMLSTQNIEKVIHKGKEIAHKLPQPRDIHVNSEKIGMPIEKTGETY